MGGLSLVRLGASFSAQTMDAFSSPAWEERPVSVSLSQSEGVYAQSDYLRTKRSPWQGQGGARGEERRRRLYDWVLEIAAALLDPGERAVHELAPVNASFRSAGPARVRARSLEEARALLLRRLHALEGI